MRWAKSGKGAVQAAVQAAGVLRCCSRVRWRSLARKLCWAVCKVLSKVLSWQSLQSCCAGTVSKFGSDAAWVAVHGWRVLRTLLCRLQGATQSAVEGAVAKLGNVAVMVKVLCRVLCRELSTVLSGVSRVQWRSLARVLCKAIRLPCCVSKNCGFPKVRTHAPATLEPWVPMEQMFQC